MKRKLLLLTALVVSALTGMRAWAAKVDYTSSITNPSFEVDEAISDLTTCGWATDRVSGWTITPDNRQNSQVGVGNKSSKIQGIGAAHDPASGDNYFYFRNNWNKNVEYAISQTVSNLPEGTYQLMVKAAYFASVNSTFTLSAKEGENNEQSYSISSKGTSDAPWETWYVIIKKKSSDTDLTIKASLKAGDANGGQHYNLLLDDFQLWKLDDSVEPMENETSYYLLNESTGQFLSAGGTWGTHAFADETGLAMTTSLSNGAYTLTPEEFSGKKLSGLYVDGTATTPWFFIETSTGSGKYYMTQDGDNYLASNGKNAELVNVTELSDAAAWTIVSKTDRISALNSASAKNPVNATFLLADPNFGRNNTAYSSWVWTFPNGENKNNSGDNTNFVVECFQKQFTFQQELAADKVPAGVYSLTAQGFYRQDGTDNENLPVFFANNETQTFPIITGGENSMTAASNSFKSGSYTIEPIYVRIEDDESLTVGAKTENEKLWCIWDNFQLKYFGDVTLASVLMAEKVSAYEEALASAQSHVDKNMFDEDKSALNTAITDNTLDLNDNNLTEEQLVTAAENLNSAAAAAVIAEEKYTTYNTAVSMIDGGTNVNLTSLIKNNGFEQGNMTGWTNSGAQQASAQGNKAFDNTQDNYYAERWHADGTVDVNQTISYLPAGIYEVSAYLYTDAGDGKLYVNETEVPFSTSNKYTAVVEIDDKASIILGAKCTLTGSTWICMDEFTLTYIGTADDLQYTLAEGKMGTDKRAAQTTAETTFNNDKTLDNYNALLVAISEAEVSVKNYQNLKAAIDKANEIKEANNVVTAEALSQFEQVIEEATTGWTNETYTDAQCLNEISVLGTSVSGWHGNANGAAGKYIASAWDGGTDTWDSYYINTWSTEGDNDGSNFSVPFFEYYTDNTKNLGDKDMTASIPVENGGYEVEAWVRVEERTDAAINANSAEKLTMTVNGGTPVTLIGNKIGNSRMYIGRFSAVGEVTDGNLEVKISVKNASNVHWFCFRDVKYKKIDGVSMSVKAGKYGTFIAPFNVAIPEDVKAYKVNKMEADGKTVKLEEVTATIPANTPVVLENTTEENFAKDFFGKNTATKDTYTEGLLTGVYNNSAEKPYVIPASTETTVNYVLQTQPAGQAFYKVESAYNMKTPNRAYLSVPAASGTEGAVKAIFFPGQGDATGINAVSTLLGGDVEGIYTVGGAKVNSLQKGVNIIRTADGKTTKVLVK